MSEHKQSIIIEGIMPNGQPFRPSDWAERLAGRLATFKNSRMIYSPYLYPCLSNGNKSLYINKQLNTSNPKFYSYVLEFAKLNQLKILTQDTHES